MLSTMTHPSACSVVGQGTCLPGLLGEALQADLLARAAANPMAVLLGGQIRYVALLSRLYVRYKLPGTLQSAMANWCSFYSQVLKDECMSMIDVLSEQLLCC